MPRNRKTPSRQPCGMVASTGNAKTVQSTAADCSRLDQRVSTTWNRAVSISAGAAAATMCQGSSTRGGSSGSPVTQKRVEPGAGEGRDEPNLVRHFQPGVANGAVYFGDVGEPGEEEERQRGRVVGQEVPPARVQDPPSLRSVQPHADHVRADGEAEVGEGGATLSRAVGGQVGAKRRLLQPGAAQDGRAERHERVPDIGQRDEEAEDLA
eukprot:scaffold6866_cov118-Isochrysis_galbana.AAC.13